MPVKTDNNATSGSRVLTIPQGVGGVTYIADDFSIDQPTKFLPQTDQNDEPLGGVTLADFITGSANLQLAASTTALPTRVAEFQEKIDPNDATATTFYVTHVGKPESKGALKRVSIQFRKKYGA